LLLEGAHEVGGDRARIIELRVFADGLELRPGLELFAGWDVLPHRLAGVAALPGQHEDLSVEGEAFGRSLPVRVKGPRQPHRQDEESSPPARGGVPSQPGPYDGGAPEGLSSA